MTSVKLEEIFTRVDNLEKRDVQEFVTLLEIMSNITFFGGIKKENCEFAKKGQCSLFYLQNNAKSKIPIAAECRIQGCSTDSNHCHLEISNITCTFCPQWNGSQHVVGPDRRNPSRRKNKRQEKQP